MAMKMCKTLILLVSIISLSIISCKKTDDPGLDNLDKDHVTAIFNDTTSIYSFSYINDTLALTEPNIRFYFPFIQSWQSQNITVSNAELVITVQSNDSSMNPLPSQLVLRTNKDSICKTILDTIKKEYRIDLSKYIQTLISGTYKYDYFTIRKQYDHTTDSLLINREATKINNLRLELKYIKY